MECVYGRYGAFAFCDLCAARTFKIRATEIFKVSKIVLNNICKFRATRKNNKIKKIEKEQQNLSPEPIYINKKYLLFNFRKEKSQNQANQMVAVFIS